MLATSRSANTDPPLGLKTVLILAGNLGLPGASTSMRYLLPADRLTVNQSVFPSAVLTMWYGPDQPPSTVRLAVMGFPKRLNAGPCSETSTVCPEVQVVSLSMVHSRTRLPVKGGAILDHCGGGKV